MPFHGIHTNPHQEEMDTAYMHVATYIYFTSYLANYNYITDFQTTHIHRTNQLIGWLCKQLQHLYK